MLDSVEESSRGPLRGGSLASGAVGRRHVGRDGDIVDVADAHDGADIRVVGMRTEVAVATWSNSANRCRL